MSPGDYIPPQFHVAPSSLSQVPGWALPFSDCTVYFASLVMSRAFPTLARVTSLSQRLCPLFPHEAAPQISLTAREVGNVSCSVRTVVTAWSRGYTSMYITFYPLVKRLSHVHFTCFPTAPLKPSQAQSASEHEDACDVLIECSA